MSQFKIASEKELSDYRIKRLKRQDELMGKMTKRPLDSNIDALFKTYASLLTVSALVCTAAEIDWIDINKAENGKRPQLAESVQRSFFQDDQLRIIDLIAYAHTKDPQIIRSTDKFDIFSGYAAAGFDYLCKRLDATARDWTKTEDVLECGKILASWYVASRITSGTQI